MHISHHADQRMNQRGISRRLVEFTLRHGRIEGDRHVLDRKESRRIIDALTEELRLAKRIMDKGGVVVVEGESDTVVTTYNVDGRSIAISAAWPLGWLAMFELMLVCGGAALGFLIAWLIGARAREQLAEGRVRLGIVEEQLQQAAGTLASTRSELAAAVGALRTQTALGAAAKALKARVLNLEGELGELRRLIA